MNPKYLIIDLFCGAGGTTTGFEMTNGMAKVVACVNHDHMAIKSHWENHPDVKHYNEDIKMVNVSDINEHLNYYRMKYPEAKVILWASLECTNFSKAKGGLARDADSRTLAKSLYMVWCDTKNDYIDGNSYIQILEPDYVMIENVREFMAWGPLDEKGKPISMYNGCDFNNWRSEIKEKFDYSDKWQMLNSADFGAFTSRERLFGIFAKDASEIVFPQPTHSKKQLNGLLPWKACKEKLDLNSHGNSIFNRKKPLVEKTLERIYAGLQKFVAKGESDYIVKYYSGRPDGKVISTKGPIGTIKTVDGHAIVNTTYLSTYYKHGNNTSINEPAPTITTRDRISIITTSYNHGTNSSIDTVAPTITTTPKLNICSFIWNPQFSNKGNSIHQPAPTIIAKQDKRPLGLIQSFFDDEIITISESDSPMTKKIKQFMIEYGISDIKMRMLFVQELKELQGFPADYKLMGNQTHQKKFIGNSVVPQVVKAWIEAMSNKIYIKQQAA